MGKIVLVMGANGAGKSTLVKEFVDIGFERVNRDEIGGTLDGQAKIASKLLDNGKNVVLDNTYPTIQSRQSIIEVARSTKSTINCVWLKTSIEEAQLNACLRMVEKHGLVQDFKKVKDPNCFPPAALFHYRKVFEEPSVDEGFESIEEREFVRTWSDKYCNKALLLDYDGTLRESLGSKDWPEDPSEVQILPGRKEKLAEYVKQGYRLLGVSNQSAIAKGLSEEKAVACFEKTNELLGFDIHYKYCPHKIPPVVCYCRKPQVGMGAYFIHEYNLLPEKCIVIGDQTSDKTFSERLGMKFVHADEFFI